MRTSISNNQNKRGFAFVYFVAIMATFFIMAFLIWVTKEYTQPKSITANRAKERAENLVTVKEAVAPVLNEYGWQDQEKGFVRVPIKRAMELTVQEWQNPTEARAELISRMEKATALPPPPPEEPSAFE
jgi:hypothetical protein